MNLFFYQASCGDAALIQYNGSDNKTHNIMIDAGFERTYRQILAAEIKTLALSKNNIDLCIISHIHDDHIGGILAYINAIKNGAISDIIDQWAYNPPRGLIKNQGIIQANISLSKSIAQGDLLAGYLLSKDKLPSVDITNEHKQIDIFGLKIICLSPDKPFLLALRNKYPATRRNPFEREELPGVSLAKVPIKNDYHIPLKDFDLSDPWEDSSIENGSSISVLVEYQTKKVLWLADAYPSVVAKSLKNMGYSRKSPLICDWVKIAHHGSKGNNLSSLYDLIQCDNYLVSANGENKYQLPSKECLARIIRGSQRTSAVCNIFFTYDNMTLRNIFKVDGENIFRELNFSVHFSSHRILSVII